MKVQDKNVVVFGGNTDQDILSNCKAGQNKKNTMTIFAGNLSGGNLTERISQKMQDARKKATKLISDQFATDTEISKGLDERRDHIKELTEEKKQLQDYQKDIEGTLAMAEKWETSTPEEEAQKQAVIKEQEEALKNYKSMEQQKTGQIGAENTAIADTKRELLKHHAMLDVQDNADAILEAASKEIIGMVWEDARDHIDEKFQEEIEQAKEAAEKKEEEEEKLETAKEKKEEAEELTEQIQESATDQVELDQELKKILKEIDTIEDEMKGLLVDSGV